MTTVGVVVPGIMGTELALPDGETVWPPKVSETLFGYRRIDKLQSPDLRATRIISKVSCVDFYNPLISLMKQVGFGSDGDKLLVEFPYDWRKDLFHLAESLAARLDQIDADEIVIVAHSMGGLISRLLLETPTYRDRPWFAKISAFYALATPHNGAPLALGRVLGLDSALGISAADFKTLAANSDYPSGYQLLPAPGEDACWNTAPDAELAALDFYDDAVATALGMDPALVARTRALHDALGNGTVPEHVRYFYFCGTGHKTVTRVNINAGTGQASMVTTRDAGDGTVPVWSALPRRAQKQVVINEHANVFRGDAFKRVFFRLFGADAGAPEEAAAGAAHRLTVSLQRPIFDTGAAVEAVLVAEVPFTKLEGALVFERRSEDDVAQEIAASIPISYRGPEILSLPLGINVALEPGIYELRYEGDRAQEDRAVFVVASADR